MGSVHSGMNTCNMRSSEESKKIPWCGEIGVDPLRMRSYLCRLEEGGNKDMVTAATKALKPEGRPPLQRKLSYTTSFFWCTHTHTHLNANEYSCQFILYIHLHTIFSNPNAIYWNLWWEIYKMRLSMERAMECVF